MNVPEYLRNMLALFPLDARRMRDIAERWEHMEKALEYAEKHLFEGGVREALEMAREPVEEVKP
jgi:predicted nuclease with TOPRIM domain